MSTPSFFSDRRRLIALVAAVVVLVALLGWLVISQSDTTTQVAPAPSETASASQAPVSPTPVESASPSVEIDTPTPSPSPTGYCQPMSEAGFEPVRYEIERFGTDETVVSLGLDADGYIAAPPKNEPRMASWWNEGPRAGAEAGKTVMSIHTYRRGGALGNQLFEGGQSALQPGDRIVVHGSEGQVACYDFVEAKKVFVSDYDPETNVMVDYDGDPLLTLIICWDHRAGTDLWDSRVFFYAKPYVGE